MADNLHGEQKDQVLEFNIMSGKSPQDSKRPPYPKNSCPVSPKSVAPADCSLMCMGGMRRPVGGSYTVTDRLPCISVPIEIAVNN